MVSFHPFVTLALAGMVVASPLKRAPNLVVSLSTGAASVNSSSLLPLSKIPDQDIKVLKFGTVLDNDLPTNSFTVTRGGQSIPFSGVLVQLSMTDLTADSFVTTPAGQSITAAPTNIGSLYKFHEAGIAAFIFAPRQDFRVAGIDSVVRDIADTLRVVAGGPSVDIHVGTDTAPNLHSSLIREWRLFEEHRYGCLIVVGGFQGVFGATTFSKPLTAFTAVASENSSSRTLSCTDPYSVCGNSVISYTVTSTANIYYCFSFYNEVSTSRLCSETTVASRNIRSGTTLHELTHTPPGTTDVVYGCSYGQSLASSSPTQAMSDADNYNYFATAFAAGACHT